jgi:hypothetical protein
MVRSPNAQIAVDLYNQLLEKYEWKPETAWEGIARLLLGCELWERGWKPFRGVVVYRESNDFKEGLRGEPGAVLRRAEDLTMYLAKQLRIERDTICSEIGLYWRQPKISTFQPHNLVGHAFKSLIVNVLQKFGNPSIAYEEEVSPHEEFPGFQFMTRSKKPKIDIVARKGKLTVALISSRWRFRHDRVDVVEEALAYAPAARRLNPKCDLLAVVGEFAPNRLDKILSACPPVNPNPPLAATVHFAPKLITEGLHENGRLIHLKGLDWLIKRTYDW